MKYAENMELVFQATHNKLMPNTSYRNKIRTLTISPTLDFRNCKSIPTQLEKYPLMETEEGKKWLLLFCNKKELLKHTFLHEVGAEQVGTQEKM